ncbi:hypothetical protein LZZ85_21185 [Terrimonas sp. NA20]|uniref:Uncharacterized protein n=1 Tax=Terrimonas ginsenosidimutans TaxID=2908004 RepID=A0ABS9KX68_9BACT|nr:hypothetical protein [Terrimonas ginsenosidimutans]MCG2616824.1 hypothetical protein [Terrimonas ginsenosidimutans]
MPFVSDNILSDKKQEMCCGRMMSAIAVVFVLSVILFFSHHRNTLTTVVEQNASPENGFCNNCGRNVNGREKISAAKGPVVYFLKE